VAAVDYFLKIEGIEGESQDSKHKNEIDVESWSWGATNSGSSSTGGGGGAGKVSVQDFHFVSAMSKASPKLFEACATGKHFSEATLTARKSGGTQQEFLTVTMTDLLVSSYQTGGSEGSNTLPLDQTSLNFSKIQVVFKSVGPDGRLVSETRGGFDVAQNKTF
jgi:type VI secretion system secreted protein Hcp